jgi:hypothetical protein
MNKHDRRFDRAREALQDGSTAAEESTRAIGNGYFTAAQAIGVFNMKLIEMAQGNAMAAVNSRQSVEDLPVTGMQVWLEVGNEQLSEARIRQLYESGGYPFPRRSR